MLVWNGFKNANLHRCAGITNCATGNPIRTFNMKGMRISASEGVPPGSAEKWMMPLEAESPSGGGISPLQGDKLQGDWLGGGSLSGDF